MRSETTLRRAVARTGMRLQKSRQSGTYQIIDAETGHLEAWGSQSGYGMTTQDVERWLRPDVPHILDHMYDLLNAKPMGNA